MIRAIFFDFGGTLLDNISFIEKYGISLDIKLLNSIGYKFTRKEVSSAVKRTIDYIETKYKGSPEKYQQGLFFRIMCRFLGIHVPIQLAIKKDREFDEEMRKHAKLMFYTVELLKWLKRKELKLTLITNASSKGYKRYAERFKIEKYFDLIVVSEEIGAEKSTLIPFRHVLEKLNVKPEEVMVVGDRMDEDIIAGKKLGMKTVRIDWKFSRGFKYGDHSEADYVVKNLRELKSILSKATNKV